METINKEFFYAHRCNNKQKETLEEHKQRTVKYLDKLLEKLDLDILLKNLPSDTDKTKTYYKNLIKQTIEKHDEGKKNPAFQLLKMNNLYFKDKCKETDNSNHSLLGAILFFKKNIENIESIENDKEFYEKFYFLLAMCFIITKHHGYLNNFEEFLVSFLNNKDIKKYGYTNTDVKYNTFKKDIYIIIKVVYSLLITADYYATLEYMRDYEVNNFGDLDVTNSSIKLNEAIKKLNDKPSVDGIDELNVLREKMFKESEENLLKNIDKNIFYLNAPTGAGKTLMSLNLALHLKPKKIFYVFPFNTLVEQSAEVFKNILGEDNITIINSTTSIKNENEENIDYQKLYLDRLFYNYPFIVTTHVNFFDILFGVGKENNFALCQLSGSVVILDEIQGYNVNLWWYMVEMLNIYADLLNFKIIIMSATLPKLDILLKKESDNNTDNTNNINSTNFVELLDSKYLQHRVFKDRVKTEFELLEKNKIEFNDIKDKIYKEISSNINDTKGSIKGKVKGNTTKINKILIEFIKKDTAKDFYEYLKESEHLKKENFKLFLLTGDDNKLYRNKVIDACKSNKKRVILVSTQVIEAGVDIDMDLGFKDISLLENEEQFIGRINRNNLKKSKVYFFNYDDASKIYKNDIRLEFNIKSYKNLFLKKDFKTYYENVLNKIHEKHMELDGFINKIDNFKNALMKLEYKTINKKMKLITTNTFTIFIPFKVKLEKKTLGQSGAGNESVVINGKEIWQQFKDINKTDNFIKKEVELSSIKEYMQYFTFNLIDYSFYKEKLKIYNDKVGNIYYIEDYESFIDDELKFDKKAFYEYQNDSIFI